MANLWTEAALNEFCALNKVERTLQMITNGMVFDVRVLPDGKQPSHLAITLRPDVDSTTAAQTSALFEILSEIKRKYAPLKEISETSFPVVIRSQRNSNPYWQSPAALSQLAPA